MPSNATYKACGLRNSGEAYRQFHSAGFLAGVHERVMALFAHPACGVAIAAMGAAGAIATVITHFVL